VILINPFTGKEVDASEEVADILLAAGFTKQEDDKPARKPRSRK
jgi:hypothetical protein